MLANRRATAAGIVTKIGDQTFRATGITAAAATANHASARTAQLYDRRSDEVSLDEIERVII
jgi:hypothetical protein